MPSHPLTKQIAEDFKLEWDHKVFKQRFTLENNIFLAAKKYASFVEPIEIKSIGVELPQGVDKPTTEFLIILPPNFEYPVALREFDFFIYEQEKDLVDFVIKQYVENTLPILFHTDDNIPIRYSYVLLDCNPPVIPGVLTRASRVYNVASPKFFELPKLVFRKFIGVNIAQTTASGTLTVPVHSIAYVFLRLNHTIEYLLKYLQNKYELNYDSLAFIQLSSHSFSVSTIPSQYNNIENIKEIITNRIKVAEETFNDIKHAVQHALVEDFKAINNEIVKLFADITQHFAQQQIEIDIYGFRFLYQYINNYFEFCGKKENEICFISDYKYLLSHLEQSLNDYTIYLVK